jgi:alkylhydroperoxidase family enzyme
MVDHFLERSGASSPSLRRDVLAHAARIGGLVREGGTVPDDLRAWVEKVSRNAWKVTDEDVAVLRKAGYDEEKIFEVTAAAAFGAGLARFEAGIRALGQGGER